MRFKVLQLSVCVFRFSTVWLINALASDPGRKLSVLHLTGAFIWYKVFYVIFIRSSDSLGHERAYIHKLFLDAKVQTIYQNMFDHPQNYKTVHSYFIMQS